MKRKETLILLVVAKPDSFLAASLDMGFDGIVTWTPCLCHSPRVFALRSGLFQSVLFASPSVSLL